MKHEEFYDYIDSEFNAIIQSEMYTNYFDKIKQTDQKKSIAFLIWFLKTYADISNVEEYITDGHDDNSCDIILEKKDSQQSTTFYIVQSKWNKKENCHGSFDGKELKSFLSDIQSILKGDKEEGTNAKFNIQYEKLRKHIKQNGRVKIIYLSLKNNCNNSDANIKSLKDSLSGDIEIEGFDLNKLKIDYIGREYKKSIPPNPLDNVYDPSLEKIRMQVCRDGSNSSVEIKAPFNAYVFLIKPKLIFELVNKYGVSLFNRNVRNPIVQSNINEEIKNTIIKNPEFFWYYNNGLTAITRRIPKISNEAEEFDITGLQIINGAQTAYAIYSAYKECNEEQRNILNEEVRITLRLLKSGGEEFDLKVTKYTNSQNPVTERDFWSNDPIQQKLQNYFFNTTFWYEKREGEFRDIPDSVTKVANFFFGSAYISFCLNGAVELMNSSLDLRENEKDLVFTSRIDNKDGLYEKIFNDSTDPRDVHASFIMLDQATQLPYLRKFNPLQLRFSNCYHLLMISRVILDKYLKQKFAGEAKATPFILKEARDYKKRTRIDILTKVLIVALDEFYNEIQEKEDDEDKQTEYMFNIMTKAAYFEMFIEKIKNKEITIEDIEDKDLSSLETDLTDTDDDDISDDLMEVIIQEEDNKSIH
ncbi:AIPR family protein [uncultured Pluralibacter sp.]|uniref:AIPR family protein n=1 Tax=uncultured Pluralibacter sp. TaxID=1490864 RepID=UPI00260206F7|nr:AIPR family protein [uncultured Pluralibacter sp.]